MKKLKRFGFWIGLILLFAIFEITHNNWFIPLQPASAQLGGGNPAGSGVAGGRFHFTGTINAVTASNTVEGFMSITGNTVATLVAATEGDAMQTVDAMTCQNLNCVTTNAAGTLTAAGGTSWTFVVDKNTVATALTCIELTAATGCSDKTHSFTTVPGDMLDIGMTPAGTPTALVVKCSMDCTF